MNVFELQQQVLQDYGRYVRSFLKIRDSKIAGRVREALESGHLWPEPLIQLNPAFQPGKLEDGILDERCFEIFRVRDDQGRDLGPLQFYEHQVESLRAACAGDNYVLTTGTGSGKSLAYIVPIVDHVLRSGLAPGLHAIVVYPMNALANSQEKELGKFLARFPEVTFARYTGQESREEKDRIIARPPHILLTNYVMLELILTRPEDRKLLNEPHNLRFLVLDELHTYRGRQGADVALLVRRTRQACGGDRKGNQLLHVGTSATLAHSASWPDAQREVARVASQVFGVPVRPERVIGESLHRVTDPVDDFHAPAFRDALRRRLDGTRPSPGEAEAMRRDPLARWIESHLGLKDDGSGRLVRVTPKQLRGEDGAAHALQALVPEVPEGRCVEALRDALLAGSRLRDEGGQPIFAFRLHQFLSKGGSVYATVEAEDRRHVTLKAQRFLRDGAATRALLPLAFCRECGQEYYVVRRRSDDGRVFYEERGLSERVDKDDQEAGFLFVDTERPWPPSGSAEELERLPDSWVEERKHGRGVRKNRKDRIPREVFVAPDGGERADGLRVHFFRAPFLFCPTCGVTYDAHQRSDFGKLATLGTEGRSSATSMLALATLRHLRRTAALPRQAKKLLSFTDNRQDASLQAGHFNDFVEVAQLRAALWRAADEAGERGIPYEELTDRVFDSLALPRDIYAQEPDAGYHERDDTDRALRQVLGYLLYRDLRYGWRITLPNLEQCGLLRIDYRSLEELCAEAREWQDRHPALAEAKPEARAEACRALLDHLRSELAIQVSYLDRGSQESILQLSNNYLRAPWALDDQGSLETASIALPRSRGTKSARDHGFVYLSPRGLFGQYLRRKEVLGFAAPLRPADSETMIFELLETLRRAGLVRRVLEPRREGNVPGYQLNAAHLIWRAGDGKTAYHNRLRIVNVPEDGLRANDFFVDLYRGPRFDFERLEAREHTAQVPTEERRDREDRFGTADLPLLFCSPTMELGVDIRELNAVNMRNVPPTPANYAQRSGRAGRGGEPAFVFTYCSVGSPHDQYFFARPRRMVSGQVTRPRLDLANEDLLRSHVHALWLAEAGLELGRSMKEVLVVEGEEPDLTPRDSIRARLDHTPTRQRTFDAARKALGDVLEDFARDAEISAEGWLRDLLSRLPQAFDQACERWRGLFRSTLEQLRNQERIARDPSRSAHDRKHARRLHEEAVSQFNLLLDASSEGAGLSDFEPYRYFASEGFLPGYNFPRLPLSAYLPGRKKQQGRDDYLSRPRFLAISEFGPRASIYHEGSRYLTNRVILPPANGSGGLEERAAQCADCGYLHPETDGHLPDLCVHCGGDRLELLGSLFRMRNVSTVRRQRIHSDEEERRRLGYELRTGVRFAERRGRTSARRARLLAADGSPLAELVYGAAATIWRLNFGERRRRDRALKGFELDVERGYWARESDEDPEDRLSQRRKRVVPYVTDSRNCLLVEPPGNGDAGLLPTLQAALKTAIQVEFELEDNELAAEPLPSYDDRRKILFYEATEGGAGVLRRLVDPHEYDALVRVSRRALEVCHFDDDGHDLGKAPGSDEPCAAACYDCLLSYTNQWDHRLLDRFKVRDLLVAWTRGTLDAASPVEIPRDDHLEELLRLTDSELERRWLRFVDAHGLRLPSEAQVTIEDAGARVDFLYRQEGAVVFVDGPHHDDPRQRETDRRQEEALEDLGWTVVRFAHDDEWREVLGRYPALFGRARLHLDPGGRVPTPQKTAGATLESVPQSRRSTPNPVDRYHNTGHPGLL